MSFTERKASLYFETGFAVLVSLLAPLAVEAHAGLVKSVPGSRAVLDRPPAKVELCFNEEVELGFSSVQLLGPGGEVVTLGSLRFGEKGRKCVEASLAGTLDEIGTYTVKYKVLSQDGHVVDYGYTFNIGSPEE